MSRILALLGAMLLVAPTWAIDAGVAFDDPELQARYEQLTEEVRCLKCQNQNLRDSNAFLAADLRREIRRLLSEGKTDAEILDFLVDRYGEFALYRPRMQGKTLILWLAPLLLLVGGGIVFVRVLNARNALPIGGADDAAEDEAN